MDFSAAFTRLIELLYVNYGIGGMMKGLSDAVKRLLINAKK